MIEDGISNDVIGCAINIHKLFGPGLLESAYKEFLCYDLLEMGYYVEKENQCLLFIKKSSWT